MLAAHNWGMVITPGPDYQKLATLYNRKTLQLNESKAPYGLFKSIQSGKFRAFQVDFIHHLTGNSLALINLHLEFGKDHYDEIIQLQKYFIIQDTPCIMGGDINCILNDRLSNMIGDCYAATNISTDGNGGVTTAHEPPRMPSELPIQKTYDGFFVNPGRVSYALTERIGGMRFNDLGNGEVEYVVYNAQAGNPRHLSIPGEPWQRIENLILRLQQERALAELEADMKLIEDKLRFIAYSHQLVGQIAPHLLAALRSHFEPRAYEYPSPRPYEYNPVDYGYIPPVPYACPVPYGFIPPGPYGFPGIPYGFRPFLPYGFPAGNYGFMPPVPFGYPIPFCPLPPGPYRGIPYGYAPPAPKPIDTQQEYKVLFQCPREESILSDSIEHEPVKRQYSQNPFCFYSSSLEGEEEAPSLSRTFPYSKMYQ